MVGSYSYKYFKFKHRNTEQNKLSNNIYNVVAVAAAAIVIVVFAAPAATAAATAAALQSHYS